MNRRSAIVLDPAQRGVNESKNKIWLSVLASQRLLEPNPTHLQDRSAHLVALPARLEAAPVHLNEPPWISL